MKKPESPVAPSFDLESSHGYILADFFEAAKTLEDGFLGYGSLIECDPDFGIDPSLFLKKTKDPKAYHTAGVPTNLYPGFLQRLAHECYRLLGDHSTLIFWFGIEFYKEAREALKEAGFKVNLNPAIWFKPGDNYGTAHNINYYLCNVTEFFFVATKGDATLGKPHSRNVFEHERPNSSARIHPTEKSVSLLEDIISTCYLIHPNSQCMIPFLGSGNTLRACKNLGIQAFGFDLSPEYRNKYLLRLEEGKNESV
jgi:DNA modification methylase